ncbi:hypothetical protein GCM10011309_03680 [Litorimonas cladophorae]|uniref:DUF885 domain-containing protein n=1 Tax=Litorimonas cladophorae TaxID=1220491 RepID=A0A918NCN6_9PROT|nr:DUF885 domain-containing protein [Litorimonas cladophorae]GGX57862.1 hypothetical protein GCM10011309_03680 [Litorimonas cladophorae]
MKKTLLLATALLSIGTTSLLSGCLGSGADIPQRESLIKAESQRLNDWFAARYEERLARSPMSRTYLGMDDGKDQLDDTSQTALDEEAAFAQAWLDEMRREFDIDRLDQQTRLSYRLFEADMEDSLATHDVSQNDYVFSHMSGPHSNIPSFLINFQSVKTAEDASAYISRLTAVQTYLGQAQARAEAQFKAGVSMPKFVYPKISAASRNVITGAPFSEGEDSPLWADVQKKFNALEITQSEKDALLADAQDALLSSVQPAYLSLLAMFDRHASEASSEDGAWKLPDGSDYYNVRLKHYTTTALTADEIHEIGLSEVARIQAEMQKIMDRVGFEGSLKDFFTFLRTDPQFTFPETDEGRDAYMAEATALIDEMRLQLDGMFITKPKANMVVQRVEPFREDTAFGAFYNSPALDGSRPGTYYVNLKSMADQPKFLMQALAYHEGIPGHHMQIAIAQELEGLPKFRTLGGHTAFIEGWALYSEALPKEIGLYTDPYKEFGQLGMEIFRAARLVVDTGIHAKKWDREQAVQYYLDNIPNPEGDVRAEIDRYIVWPGQATAYMIGKLKIEELRKKAESELGDQFDIRRFHDTVLANGSVPLSVLEELVDAYIQDTKSETN